MVAMNGRTWFAGVVGFALAVLLQGAELSAQVQLKYRYSPNQTLYYELKQSLVTTSLIEGQEIENTLSQNLQMGTHVDSVNADGSAQVSKRIYRIQMEATHPRQDEPIRYDSNQQQDLPGPFRMIADSLSQLVNRDIQMLVSETGETSQVRLPEDMERKLAASPVDLAGNNTPEGIKKMISQGSVIFPERPVQLNQSWTRDLNTALPFGTMTSTIQLTYAGLTKEGLHRINATSKISLTPKEGNPFQVTMRAADGRGIYLFDADRGCIYASALKQTMDLEMTAAGQTLQQKVVTDITMRLVEPNRSRTATR